MRVHRPNSVALAVGVAAASLMASASAVDVERGRLLYENHCTVCHESNVHVRQNRRASNRTEIMAMIKRFSTHLELDWSSEEMLDVLEYLDQQYYKTGVSTN